MGDSECGPIFAGRVAKLRMWSRTAAGALWLLVGVVAPAPGVGGAAIEAAGAAEEFVLSQFNKERPAIFSNGVPSNIRGSFVRKLLSCAATESTEFGVMIVGASIEGEIELANCQCSHDVRLEHCRFKGPVNFRNTRFQNALSLAGSAFEDDVDLRDIKLGGHLQLSEASFSNSVAASFAEISGNVFASGAFFNGVVLFNQAKIGLSLNFDSSCIDTQRLEGTGLTTNEALVALETALVNGDHDKNPTFRFARGGFGAPREARLKAGEWLLIDGAAARMFAVSVGDQQVKVWRKTYFSEGIDLQGSSIKSYLRANNTCFTGRVNGDGLDVGSGLYAEGSQFEEGVTLGYAKLGNELSARWALFLGTNIVNLYGIKTDAVLLSNCQFDGLLSLEHSAIATALEVQASMFANTNVSAIFYGLKAKEMDISGAEFAGSANFGSAEVSRFVARGAYFGNANRMVTFHGFNVMGTATFDNAVFAGPVNFILMTVDGNFGMENARFENTFDVKGLKALTDGASTYNADFGGMHVAGLASFARAQLAGRISFRNANIQNFHLDSVLLLYPEATPNELRLEGLGYKAIRASDIGISTHTTQEMRQSWARLKELLQNHTPYSFDVYEQLENYFDREGERALADEAFVAGKRRERTEVMPLGPMRFFSWVLDVTVSYGRKPSRALYWSLIPIVLGTLIFRKEHMVSTDSKELPAEHAVGVSEGPDYRTLSEYAVPEESSDTAASNLASERYPFWSLWFSIDVFLPVIDLWADEHWIPRRGDTLRWTYMLIHKSLGWVLVPIGLAAFSGIIK